MKSACVLLTAVVGLASGRFVRGEDRKPSVATPAYGTASRIQYHVGIADFTPSDTSGTHYASATAPDFFGRYGLDPYVLLYASPHLPTGARLSSFELDYCDSDAHSHIHATLQDCDYLGGDCHVLGSPMTTAEGSGHGCGFLSQDLTGNHYTLENDSRQLLVSVVLTSGTPTNVLTGAYVGYVLQVSPGPASATFSDVPTSSPQFKFVEALYAAGITSGCGGGNFCPNLPVTRGQIAVFLATALGLHFPD